MTKYMEHRCLTFSGVVTKLGVHITPAPEAYATAQVSVPTESDLAPLLTILCDLMRKSVILNSASIANAFRTVLLSGDPEVDENIKR